MNEKIKRFLDPLNLDHLNLCVRSVIPHFTLYEREEFSPLSEVLWVSYIAKYFDNHYHFLTGKRSKLSEKDLEKYMSEFKNGTGYIDFESKFIKHSTFTLVLEYAIKHEELNTKDIDKVTRYYANFLGEKVNEKNSLMIILFAWRDAIIKKVDQLSGKKLYKYKKDGLYSEIYKFNDSIVELMFRSLRYYLDQNRIELVSTPKHFSNFLNFEKMKYTQKPHWTILNFGGTKR
jgi:hypothetical protein